MAKYVANEIYEVVPLFQVTFGGKEITCRFMGRLLGRDSQGKYVFEKSPAVYVAYFDADEGKFMQESATIKPLVKEFL